MGAAIALPIVAAGTAIIDVAAVVVGAVGTAIYIAEHTKNKRPSTEDKHEKGEARRRRDQERAERRNPKRRRKCCGLHVCVCDNIYNNVHYEEDHSEFKPTKGDCHFYAFPYQAPGTEPVYGFWNDDLKEHTYHMGGTWSNETNGLIHWFAFPPGQQGANSFPVHSFWDDANRSHSFHMGDPWYPGETKGDIHFYAYNYQHPGTFPVHSYWDDEHRDHAYAMVLA